MSVGKVYIVGTFKRLKLKSFVYKEVFLLYTVCCNLKIKNNIRVALKVIIIFVKSAENIVGFKVVFIYQSQITLVLLVINFITGSICFFMKLGYIIPGLCRKSFKLIYIRIFWVCNFNSKLGIIMGVKPLFICKGRLCLKQTLIRIVHLFRIHNYRIICCFQRLCTCKIKFKTAGIYSVDFHVGTALKVTCFLRIWIEL